jgi:anaerobic selenocysteine-containing dehydrogenase
MFVGWRPRPRRARNLAPRELGTNNLPDCSNRCREASGRALSAALGTGKSTVDLVDWDRRSRSAIVAWCLGITQQEHAADTVREIINVLLMRGNLGREGAGPCPIRGHSNVQGNRTCGIDLRTSIAIVTMSDLFPPGRMSKKGSILPRGVSA